MTTRNKYSWYKGTARSRIRAHVAKALPELGIELAPKAPPPPYFVPLVGDELKGEVAVWRDTCRGGLVYRCGTCALCEWEKKANRWAAVAPWYQPARLARPAGAPKWTNVHAALRALAEHELYGRSAKSPTGEILDNLRRGAIRLRRAGTTYRRDREDPIMAKASEVAWIDRAIMRAYHGNRWGLPIDECKALLLACTDGVLPRMPKLFELAEATKLPADLCRGVVRFGRRTVTVELAARGLIPMPPRQLGLHDPVDRYRRRRGWER